jgi:hypothetical protein
LPTPWKSHTLIREYRQHHGNQHVPWCQRKAELRDTSPWSPIGRKLGMHSAGSNPY